MCGITGYFNQENHFDPQRFAKANNIIRHRGPDDFGYISFDTDLKINIWKDENLKDFNSNPTIGALGFRRLSIIDLSPSGHQPMSDNTGDYWIVFNGEIYNYIELRQELEQKSYRFNSNTDTEVILNAYREWDTECLDRFNGMWAFCILDKKKKKLFCSRDRLGIKPFYYTLHNNSFAFSSEIKQLLELFPNSFNKINNRLAFDFLALGSYGNETRETYFEGIVKLNAGCYLEIDLNGAINPGNEKEWWNLPRYDSFIKLNDNDVFEKLAFLLEDSVKLRLRSDVPVGTALSGGLDSSGIVCLLNKIYNENADSNKVFTISSNDKANDDSYYANIIINSVPVTSFMQNFEDHANLNELEKFTWHQDEPLQTASIFGSWQLYRFIKEQGITVALDGQGADELMGGYNRYPFRKYLSDTMHNNGFSNYLSQVKQVSVVHKKPIPDILLNTLISAFTEKTKLLAPQFFYLKKIRSISPLLNKSFLSEQMLQSKIVNKAFSNQVSSFHSMLKQESYELTRHTNLPGILRQVDRNSMAFSVESRLPFLDFRLVEFLFTLPPRYMINNGYTKYAYRMSMKDTIPNEVLWRKSKIGFRMPEFEILNHNKAFVKELLFKNGTNDFINKPMLEKEIDTLLSQKSNYNNVVWRMLCFSIWKNTFKMS